MNAKANAKKRLRKSSSRKGRNTAKGNCSAAAVSTAPEPAPPLDPRLFALILEALTLLESFIVSRIAKLPYSELRTALGLQDVERKEVIEAAQAIGERHKEWLREHGGPAFFLAAVTAAQVMKFDALLLARSESDPSADPSERRQELIWGMFFIFLPALLFVLIFLFGKWSQKK